MSAFDYVPGGGAAAGPTSTFDYVPGGSTTSAAPKSVPSASELPDLASLLGNYVPGTGTRVGIVAPAHAPKTSAPPALGPPKASWKDDPSAVEDNLSVEDSPRPPPSPVESPKPPVSPALPASPAPPASPPAPVSPDPTPPSSPTRPRCSFQEPACETSAEASSEVGGATAISSEPQAGTVAQRVSAAAEATSAAQNACEKRISVGGTVHWDVGKPPGSARPRSGITTRRRPPKSVRKAEGYSDVRKQWQQAEELANLAVPRPYMVTRPDMGRGLFTRRALATVGAGANALMRRAALAHQP